jgi:hypothetical protein
MAFASTNDIADRLGRDLSAGEEQSVTLLLEGAQAIIEDHAQKAEADMAEVPGILRFVAIELVCRALANPNQLASLSEGLGQHNYTARFRDTGIWLTKAEELLVSRAVHGTTTASVAIEAHQVEEVHDLIYGS